MLLQPPRDAATARAGSADIVPCVYVAGEPTVDVALASTTTAGGREGRSPGMGEHQADGVGGTVPDGSSLLEGGTQIETARLANHESPAPWMQPASLDEFMRHLSEDLADFMKASGESLAVSPDEPRFFLVNNQDCTEPGYHWISVVYSFIWTGSATAAERAVVARML